MRLGEAKNLLTRLSLQILSCEHRLAVGDASKINEVLEEVSEHLLAQQILRKRIKLTESYTAIDSKSLLEIHSILQMLEEKIRLLEILSVRADISPAQRGGIENQLLSYRSTRDTLRIGVEKCNWETDLLDE